jgi:hypothetical protein
MLHEGGGCPVNRGRERTRERRKMGPLACARMEVGRAASPHWPELGHLQRSTCQAYQVRSSGNMPVSSECGLGQSNEVVSWGHAASPGREALGRRHQLGKVWLGQGSRRRREKPDGPGRPIKLGHRETRADLTRRRGLRLDGIQV